MRVRGSSQLPLVPQISRRDPDSRQGAIVEQRAQTLSVELVRLMDQAHHDLRLGGVGQHGNTAGGLDLVYDPVPIADCFQGDGHA